MKITMSLHSNLAFRNLQCCWSPKKLGKWKKYSMIWYFVHCSCQKIRLVFKVLGICDFTQYVKKSDNLQCNMLGGISSTKRANSLQKSFQFVCFFSFFITLQKWIMSKILNYGLFLSLFKFFGWQYILKWQ